MGVLDEIEIDVGIDGLTSWAKVGAGGFATVYSAVDEGFGRTVAVKVLQHVDEAGRRRFDRERFSMGRLASHRHVVTPYSSGFTGSGRPYVVMEYIDGGSLADLLTREKHIEWDQAVGYVIPIADALAHAHAAGILHRDVKPENILISSEGVVKLTDFGIAMVQERTATQSVGFSLAHAPPETFRGGTDQRDERSDLYSLASTLYTLVTGRTPFASVDASESQLAHLERIATHPVPRLKTDAVGADFLATALAKNPDDRPSTAEEFIRLLEKTMTEPVESGQTAVPIGPRSTSALSTSALSVAARHQRVPSSSTRREAGPPTGIAADSERHRPELDRQASSPRGTPWIPIGLLVAALVLAGVVGVASIMSPSDTPQGAPVTTATEPATTDLSSPQTELDDEQAPTTIAPAGITESIRYDLANDVASDLAVVTQDHLLVVPTVLGQTYIWDTDDANTLPTVYLGHVEEGLATDPKAIDAAVARGDGRIASGGSGATVQIWDPTVHPGRLDATFEGHEGPVTSLAVLLDGRVASGSLDGTVRIHYPNDPQRLAIVFGQHQAPVTAMAVLTDGRIASASLNNNHVLVWNADDPNASPVEFDGHQEPIISIAALPDGRVASASQDGTVFVWDPGSVDQSPIVFDRHPRDVVHVAALSDGRIASAGGDTVLVWDPDNLEAEPLVYGEHEGRISALTALPDGRIASAGHDETVRIWDPRGLQ